MLILAAAHARSAVTLNQIETFAGAHEWESGDPNPSPPAIQQDAGPLGGGDHSLRVTANGGSGAGSRLIVFNQSAWTGDYSGQGIVSIAANLRNNGFNPLSIRLAFNGPGGWFVTPAEPLPAFGGWSRILFDIRPSALLSAEGTDVAATMAGVTQLRILHASTPTFRGASVSGSFLVDDIEAVPEPGSLAMLALAGAFTAIRKR